MTAQEALSLLNDMEFNKNYQGVQEYTEMLLVCKEALDKQIPKKCRIKSAAELQTFYCPTCEQVVVSRIENEWLAGRLQKYCDNCGQALDWSENND